MIFPHQPIPSSQFYPLGLWKRRVVYLLSWGLAQKDSYIEGLDMSHFRTSVSWPKGKAGSARKLRAGYAIDLIRGYEEVWWTGCWLSQLSVSMGIDSGEQTTAADISRQWHQLKPYKLQHQGLRDQPFRSRTPARTGRWDYQIWVQPWKWENCSELSILPVPRQVSWYSVLSPAVQAGTRVLSENKVAWTTATGRAPGAKCHVTHLVTAGFKFQRE